MAVDNKARYLTAATPCPICHGYERAKKGERCWGYGTDGWAHCTRAEYAAGLPLGSDGAYAHKLAGSCKCGRSHGDVVPVVRPAVRDHDRTREQDAPVWVRDAVYQRYLALCPLRPEHLAVYARRGEVDAMVAQAYGYGSLPRGRDEAQRVVAALIREFGEHTLLTVPGFWAQKGGRPTTHTGSATDDSAVIPCRDERGKITALVRHTMSGSGSAAKYRNFSGSREVHTVATGGVFGQVYIVEGIHKAHVAAEAGGVKVLGLAGAELTAGSLATLEAMHTEDGLVVALDAPDVRANKHVRDAHARLLHKLEAWPNVAVADWPDAHGKGLDDIIKAGHWPVLKPLPKPDAEEDGTPPDADARTKALAAERIGRFRARRASPWAPGVLRSYDLSGALDNDALAALVQSAVLATAPPSAQDKAWELAQRAERAGLRVRHCGGFVRQECRSGHEQAPKPYTCHEGGCALCSSTTGINIAHSDGLDDLTGDAHYAHIELLLPVTHDGVDREGDYAEARKRWQAAVAKLSGRKAWHGRILWRSIAAHLSRTSSTLSLRVAVRVESAADAQTFADDLWGLLPEALPSDPVLTQTGEAIIDQAIEDASMTVLSMTDPDDTELYVQWCLATKGCHLFQSLAVFAKTVKAAAKRLAAEPLVCEVPGCTAPVHAVSYHPRTAYVELEAAFRAQAAAPPGQRQREAVRA